MANAAPSGKAGKRGRAETVIAEAAQERGWVRLVHRLHDHVWGRGPARLIIGYSPSRHTVHTALFYPQGFGTGYIDDPTPSSQRRRPRRMQTPGSPELVGDHLTEIPTRPQARGDCVRRRQAQSPSASA